VIQTETKKAIARQKGHPLIVATYQKGTPTYKRDIKGTPTYNKT